MVLLLVAAAVLSACQGGIDSVFPKAEVPIPDRLVQKMKAKGMKASSPILIRIYKTENVLEVWKQKSTGRFDLLESYEICKWSGKLGPKFKEGDRQAPEGFYRVGRAQMNPKSDYHLSFNIGYPNTFDRSHDRTGSHLMVHGACSSAGCYSMTDERVEEIYALAREAMKGGQDYFQVQAYPFKMTARNLAKHAAHPHFEFWKMLKEGSDLFELTNYPPKVDVCEKRYLFNRVAEDEKAFKSRAECPPVTMPGSLLSAWREHLDKEKAEFRKALTRHKLLGTFKETALAGIDVENISMMAKGSEVLPPATPEKEPEPAKETQETAPVASNDTTPGMVSGSANEAVLAGNEAEEVAAPETAPQTGDAVAANPPVETREQAEQPGQNADNVVRAIPVPRKAPRDGDETNAEVQSVQAQQPAGQQAIKSAEKPKRKKPWWARKSVDENAPVSLIQPSQ